MITSNSKHCCEKFIHLNNIPEGLIDSDKSYRINIHKGDITGFYNDWDNWDWYGKENDQYTRVVKFETCCKKIKLDHELKWDGPVTIFIVGEIIYDFLTVDKAKLFALNFSATQELDRQQQADKAEIAELKTEVATLKSELAAIKQHLGI